MSTFGEPAEPEAHPAGKTRPTSLLRACEGAGTIRPGVTPDDFLLTIAGLWQIPPDDNWQPRTARLLGRLMDGLRGAPATPRPAEADDLRGLE